MAACSTVKVQYVSKPLPLPDKPVLEEVTGEQLMCLDGEVYRKLVRREQTLKNYILNLRGIIETTHEKDKE